MSLWGPGRGRHQAQGTGRGTTESKLQGHGHKPSTSLSHQALEEAGRILPLESLAGVCWPPGCERLKLPGFKPSGCGDLCQQPQDNNLPAFKCLTAARAQPCSGHGNPFFPLGDPPPGHYSSHANSWDAHLTGVTQPDPEKSPFREKDLRRTVIPLGVF